MTFLNELETIINGSEMYDDEKEEKAGQRATLVIVNPD